MKKQALENLAKKMYSLVNLSKHQFFRKSYYPVEDGPLKGKTIPWNELSFEKDFWFELASLAIAASDKLNKEENAKKTHP